LAIVPHRNDLAPAAAETDHKYYTGLGPTHAPPGRKLGREHMVWKLTAAEQKFEGHIRRPVGGRWSGEEGGIVLPTPVAIGRWSPMASPGRRGNRLTSPMVEHGHHLAGFQRIAVGLPN